MALPFQSVRRGPGPPRPVTPVDNAIKWHDDFGPMVHLSQGTLGELAEGVRVICRTARGAARRAEIVMPCRARLERICSSQSMPRARRR